MPPSISRKGDKLLNELQTIQFDILQTFWAICERLELHPYLICGSALGAVKYQGFIPWDDDVDVALIRPEYERFLKEAPAMLPKDLFLQNARTDPAFPQLYSKIRKNGTSFVEERAAHLPIHHGIYVDLFPLDGLPEDKRSARKISLAVRLCKMKLLCVYGPGGSRKERFIRRLGRLFGWHRHTDRIIRRTEKAIAAFDPAACKVWGCHGNWRTSRDHAPAEQYGSGVPALFEGLPVRIPAQYDAYLTQRYGDWRADLPSEQQHGRRAKIDTRSDRLWRQP